MWQQVFCKTYFTFFCHSLVYFVAMNYGRLKFQSNNSSNIFSVSLAKITAIKNPCNLAILCEACYSYSRDQVLFFNNLAFTLPRILVLIYFPVTRAHSLHSRSALIYYIIVYSSVINWLVVAYRYADMFDFLVPNS